MIVGYARVSTDEQKLDLQLQALSQIGCDEIFTDQGESGRKFSREGLKSALGSLEPGSTLAVWRLDRLGRSLTGLVGLMEELGNRDVHFRSLTENIDTSSSGGRLMFHMMAALAEFERTIISERTRAGLEAAKKRGKTLGRPSLLTSEQIEQARNQIELFGEDPLIISKQLKVSKRTLMRHLKKLL